MTDAPGGSPGYPVNLLVRGRRVVVVGAGRIAARKIEPLLDLGARVVVVAPDAGDRGAGAGPTPAGCALAERAFRAADLDGAWLALTATDDPGGRTRRCTRPARRRRVWVNSADDPANCSFTLMSVIRRADLVVTRRHRRPQPGAGRAPPAARSTEELGPEYETLLDLLSEAREALRAAGRSSEDADWQRAFDSGIVDLVRAGRVDEAKELLELVSLIVVGLNHRTVPGRPARADDGARASSSRRCSHDLAAASTCSRSWCSPRATAPRSTRAARTSTPRSATSRDFLAAYSGADRRRVRRPALHVLRRRRGRAPVLGRGRPRLDDRRRERDPRPGPRGVAGRRARSRRRRSCSRGCSGTRSSRASGCAPRPASAATRCRSRRPRSPSPPSTSARSTAQRARRRRGPDGHAASRRRCASRGVDRDRGSRTARRHAAPQLAAERSAAKRSRSTRSPTRSSTPTCCSRRPRRREVLIERSTIEMVMACRDGRPLLVVDVALPRDVDPGCAARSTTSRCSTSTTSRTSRSARPSGAGGEIGKVREILAAEIERYRAERAGARGRAARHRRCASSARTYVRASSTGSAPSSTTLDPDSARARRGVHAGHRQQAPARADGAGEGRGRNAARRLLRRRARDAVRPLRSARRTEPECSASRRAAARSRAGRPSASARCSASRRRVRGRHDDRRPRPDVRSARDRRHRRVREGGAAGGARRARRSRGALGQGPSVGDAARSGARRGSRTRRSPRRAGRCDARRSSRPVGASRPVRCAGARSSRPRGPTSRSRPLRGNIETRLRKRAEQGYDAVVVAVAALERLGLARPKRPRCSTRR